MRRPAVKTETITENDEMLIRRMVLDPGEAMFWHIDLCRRFSVVVRGSRLSLEYRDTGETVEFPFFPVWLIGRAPIQNTREAVAVTGTSAVEHMA